MCSATLCRSWKKRVQGTGQTAYSQESVEGGRRQDFRLYTDDKPNMKRDGEESRGGRRFKAWRGGASEGRFGCTTRARTRGTTEEEPRDNSWSIKLLLSSFEKMPGSVTKSSEC